ncbi:DNA gyrase inhibitor YacG [Marinospirillum sp.]|uniref:DNA gyrase inhibitor YacG n=1 Tax=Marinospirillum sp. TaxID=2183934 RepID=UPI00384C00DD
MQQTPTRIFPCPGCGQASIISQDNPWRPFCSERCKLIDLGSWAAEEHKIAGEPALDEMEYDESLFTRNE